MQVVWCKTNKRNESKRCESCKSVNTCRSKFFDERFEYEHIGWDPKDGELNLKDLKPKETLVEESRSVNVQITFDI